MSESASDEQSMVKLQASSAPMGQREAMLSAYHRDNDEGEEGATVDNMDPSRPFLVIEKLDLKTLKEWKRLRSAWVAKSLLAISKSLPNEITIPDPTPKWVHDAFCDIRHRLGSVLKDSVRSFLRFFLNSKCSLHWNLSITSETLTFMISYNALRCAKVVLEGKAPELNCMRANPNCMNPFAYFPIHEAAERFSVDMIKLLFHHGASANVRTVGKRVIEGLLPLHVAVENACLHKYLEENLFPIQDHQDYIYKLIHLLCLPEMKIFLDTTRLIAAETDNLVDEIWNYMKDGKLLQAAVILLAAQGQIRGGFFSESNINGNQQNGFNVIMHRIVIHFVDGKWVKDENGKAQEHLDEMRLLSDCAFLLVDLISQAGEDLDSYIQKHSEVPHAEVLKRVSSILMDRGFCPTGESIEVENLRPYDCKIADREFHDKVTGTAHLHAVEGKAVRKKLPTGYDPTYERRSYFPYWRSVLASRRLVRVYPSYAAGERSVFDVEQLRFRSSNPMGKIYSPTNHNLGLLERIRELKSNPQSIRCFGTAALMLLSRKVPCGKRCC